MGLFPPPQRQYDLRSVSNRMEPKKLRLFAHDRGDLEIVSAAVQDAIVFAGNIHYDAGARRMSLELDRFMWEAAGRKPPFMRSRAVVSVEGVLAVRSRGVARDDSIPMSVLQVEFSEADTPPGGALRLVFAGNAEIWLSVECLDVILADVGPVWSTRRKPLHDGRDE